MGVSSLISVGVSFLLSAAASAYALLMGGNQKGDKLAPATLDSFGITQVKEGSVVPMVYGRVRTHGNLIYYGNLTSKEIIQKPEGGKGITGGGGGQVIGYTYFLDVWQTIGIGKLSIIGYYVDDNEKTPEAEVTLFNNGENGVYPGAYLVGSSPLPGVSHIFYKALKLGDNVTNLPTIHFVTERELATGLPHENMSNGNNPAAIIYDLLTNENLKTPINPGAVDWTSFSNAADYYYSRGQGLNFIFTAQKNIFDNVNRVLSQVGGTFYINSNGKLALQAPDPSQVTSRSLVTSDFKSFSLKRPSYSQLPNYLKATYIDSERDYSNRVAAPYVNEAAIQIAGRVIEKSIDLKGFRLLDTTNSRLAEIAKYLQYPTGEIEFETNFKFASLSPGSVIEIEFTPLGITSAKFRIDSIDYPEIDSLTIKFKATQLVEAIFDTNYSGFGGSEWLREPAIPSKYPNYRSEFVLPYNPQTKGTPTRIYLIDRAKDYEIGYQVRARAGSPPALPYLAGSDATNGYWTADTLQSFSRLVNISVPVPYVDDPTLYQNYPEIFDHTYTIDDQYEGITIYTYQNPLDLTLYEDLTRPELFTKNRFLFVSTLFSDGSTEKANWYHHAPEIIAFQKLEAVANPVTGPFSDPDYKFYKITGFLRGALYTSKKSHKYEMDGSTLRHPKECWLFEINYNIIEESKDGNYRVVLPRTFNAQADEADTHPYFPSGKTFAVTQKEVFDPINICGSGRIFATRSGSSITVKYYPATYSSENGAGKGNPDLVTDSDVFDYPGSLFFSHGSTVVEKTSPDVNYSFTDAASVILTVYQIIPGKSGRAVEGTVTIGTADGNYVAYTERN